MSGQSTMVAFAVAFLAVVSCGSAADNGRGLRVSGTGTGGKQHSLIVQSNEAEQQLVICNAYASPEPLDIIRVEARQRLTSDGPLSYKQCREFVIPLKDGDQLDFKTGELDVGTFFATGLPKSTTSLLLIAHRREPNTKSVSFESHAFTDLPNPQIAVIDAYRGSKKAAIKIIEHQKGEKNEQAQLVEEDLRYNSVVAINPGKYQIKLSALGEQAEESIKPLHAQDHTKYIVMRTGGEVDTNKTGYNYPQELIVFPNGASSMAHLSLAVALLLSAASLSLSSVF